MTVVGLKPVKGPRVMLAGDKGMDQLRETGGVGEVKVMFKGPVMKTPPGSTECTKNILVLSDFYNIKSCFIYSRPFLLLLLCKLLLFKQSRLFPLDSRHI